MDYIVAGILTLALLAIVTVLALYKWEYGLFLSLASLSLINRLKTEYFIDFGFIIITAETLFIGLILIAWLIHLNASSKDFKFRPYMIKPIMLFFLAGGLSFICSLDIRISMRLFIAGVIQPIILFYLIVNNIKTLRQVVMIVSALIISAGIATGYGLWQIYLTFSGSGNAFDYRIVSVFYSPAIFGEILLLSFPLVVVTRLSLSKERRVVRLLFDALLGGMIVAILLTITRSVWLGLVASLIVLLVSSENRTYFYKRITVVLILLIFVVVKSGVVTEISGLLELFQRRPASLNDFGDQTTSIGERIFAWKTAVVMILDNPIGIGLGMFQRTWPKYQPLSAGLDAAHNLLLDIGVEMGILGIFSFVWIIFDALRLSIRLARTSLTPYISRLALGILSGLVGYFIHSFTGGAELAHNDLNVAIVPLGSPITTGMLVFWSLIGCLYVLRNLDRRNRKSV